MNRVVIDTNIIVSGLLFGGLPLTILTAAIDRRFVSVTTPDLIEELERVLGSKKFGLSNKEIEVLTAPISESFEIVVPTMRLETIKRCPGDNRVLECALEGQCSFIVTGDRRDLLSIESFHRVQIVTARQFVEKVKLR